jgi:long-chain acyl-CoA synthetase
MPCAGAAISKTHLRFFHAAGIFVCYGYGATETSATVSCFKSDVYDFNTVGTIMPGIEVKISPDEEIMVKGGTVFQGYYKKPLDTEKVLKDGWYYTGDKGYITENGDLVMSDRIKDLMKTSIGKYISPQKIELLFIQDSFIEQILPIGDGRKYVTALIVPSFSMLMKEAESLGLQKLSPTELIKHESIIRFYQEKIEKIQEEFTPYERIVKFKLLAEPFSIQNGGLTNTLKVRRNKLIEHYRELIDEMYL